MEKEQRNALRTAVVKVRRLLEKELQGQLEGAYNILPDGRVLENAPGDPIVRARLLDVIEHHRAGGAAPDEAVESTVREAAFTVLNRFVALKMAERRGLVRECVSQGLQSEGIRELAECAPGLRAALEDGGYRILLEAVTDEISLDLKVLFDRSDAIAPLWPRPKALEGLLETLNNSQLGDIWAEDEAIGWIYQYFNHDDVKRMRTDSSAPRNSRELAVRNQFFTPRYVVEFLGDNTLGRIWYEMNDGQTRLKDECRYLVRRPNEIFLQPGEAAPEQPQEDDLSQEELLQQVVYIPHRALKDPRDILMMDPACGSMHFGLYAFDLFEVIYDEAWEIAHGGDEARKSCPTFASFVSVVGQQTDKAAFLAEVPRLIVEHNLHGIDIDPRAVQVAGLALWLRAQRAWQQQARRPQDRPRIRRSNIVCAEPMPGEEAFLDEFIEKHLSATPEQDFLGQLVRRVFSAMTLAGEAGSLLKIEEEIVGAVAQAKQSWLAAPRHVQGRLFADGIAQPGQEEFEVDGTGITDESFWQQAEERIYAALQTNAEEAEQSGRYQRRLFTDDAARGFAFIDLCRRRYDLVLMNPPFGAFPQAADSVLNREFQDCRGDLYPAFMQRWGKRSGILGAITNRTGLTLRGLAPWRQSTLLSSPRLVLLADLGMGVLDALVETALFVLEDRASGEATTLDLLATPKTQAPQVLLSECSSVRDGRTSPLCFIRDPDDFRSIPGSPICYRIPTKFLKTFGTYQGMERNGFVFRSTSPNYDDFRFLRLRWEAPATELGRYRRWSPLAKGGEYRPYYSDIELLIDWDDSRQTFRGFTGSVHRPMERPACANIFFSPGLTWSGRTASRFAPRVLPAGSIFSSKGPYAGGMSPDHLLSRLGVMMSAPFQSFLELFVQAGDATSSGSAARDYQVGALRSLPDPSLPEQDARIVRERTSSIIRELMVQAAGSETSALFAPRPVSEHESLVAALRAFSKERVNAVFEILSSTRSIDEIVSKAYGFGPEETAYMESLFGRHPLNYPSKNLSESVSSRMLRAETDEIIQQAVATGNTGRFITVKGYYADRHLEVVAHVLGVSPEAFRDVYAERACSSVELQRFAVEVASQTLGVAFGRWDVRFAANETPTPELPNPFAPLPTSQPGLLQSAHGLPPTEEGSIRLEGEGLRNYPVRIPWDGILVDDAGHPLDIDVRVRDVLHIIWKDRAEHIEAEACEILGVRKLRDYFRSPALFFADHVRLYSKSRRKAPIYWPLSTASGSYTVWIYYHRLTADSLFQVVVEYLDPRIRKVQEERPQVDSRLGRAEGREAAKLAKQAGALAELEQELEEMKAELLRVAELPYKPDLNDGVQITAAPLWRLFRLPAWRKVLEATWKKLEKGEYDWAHLAYAIWPERVQEKCKTDRSLAIAHELENLCEVMVVPKKKRTKRSNA